jgi:RimJ/RimL family protein N-acetyltransferase
MFGPILTGEKVRLGPICAEQLQTVIPWFADLDVRRYLGGVAAFTLEQEKEWYERISKSDHDVVWGTYVDERLIGVTGIHQIDWINRHAITGNLIGEKGEWGKGYGSEAVALRTRFAFDQLNLEKLKTKVFLPNAASRRALEKAGYIPCGLERRELFREGTWHDAWLAEILRDDWRRAAAETT